MKLVQILKLNTTLKSIIDDKANKISPVLKFKFLGIMKQFESHIANFEVVRNDKIKEYGSEDEEGNIRIPEDDTDTLKKFSDELKDVLNSDVDITLQKIKADVIFDAGLPSDYLVALYDLIEE